MDKQLVDEIEALLGDYDVAELTVSSFRDAVVAYPNLSSDKLVTRAQTQIRALLKRGILLARDGHPVVQLTRCSTFGVRYAPIRRLNKEGVLSVE